MELKPVASANVVANDLIHPTLTAIVIGQVVIERNRQDRKWGEQTHTLTEWLSILMEEVGEAAHDINEFTFTPANMMEPNWPALVTARKELLEVAAVAIAAVECIDRQYGDIGPDGPAK